MTWRFLPHFFFQKRNESVSFFFLVVAWAAYFRLGDKKAPVTGDPLKAFYALKISGGLWYYFLVRAQVTKGRTHIVSFMLVHRDSTRCFWPFVHMAFLIDFFTCNFDLIFWSNVYTHIYMFLPHACTSLCTLFSTKFNSQPPAIPCAYPIQAWNVITQTVLPLLPSRYFFLVLRGV